MKILESRTVGKASWFAAELAGGRRIELGEAPGPGRRKAEHWVLWISAQAGCAVGCRMCDAGAAGYQGNLSAAELLEQVRFLAARAPDLDLARHPRVEVDLSRMGEPSLNPAVLPALRALRRDFPRAGLAVRVSSVAPRSPVVASWFAELRRVKDECFPRGRFELQFSLHGTDEAGRRAVVPVRKWSLPELADFGRRFLRPGDRPVALSFAPAAGESLDAGAIAEAFDPGHFRVRITPINPTLSAGRTGSAHAWARAPAAIRGAAAELRKRGFAVALEPAADCGQLWSRRLRAMAAAGLRARRREQRSYVTTDSMAQRAAAWLSGLPVPRWAAFAPERAALLVLGMPERLMDPRSRSYLPPARAALWNTRRLAEAFRVAGRPVFFRCADRRSRPARVLEPRPGEVLRSTAWLRRLRAAGVRQVVLAGARTDRMVLAAARSVRAAGWPVFVAADATAAGTEARQVAALQALARGAAAVAPAEAIAGRLARAALKS